MRISGLAVLSGLLLSVAAVGATRQHTISFGKTTVVKVAETEVIEIHIRPLYVDGRLKEYTTGATHEVTDRLLVVQRAFRLNDSLREETAPRWIWQRGGWLLVDRITGRVSPLNLPDFEPYHSAVSWYRDYAAYCGGSSDGKKVYPLVAQLGHRKPVFKGPASDRAGDKPESDCPMPSWQRNPARVTFTDGNQQKLTYEVHGHVVDLAKDPEEDEPSSE
jgi:hypothetical protein